MAPGNSTKLAAWSGWWCGVISRKSSAAGISWSVLTAWWHPTAPCASSGKCVVYPQGSQIIGSEELKTGKICQITEHMPLPVSAVVPDTARVRCQTDTITDLSQKAKGSWMYFFVSKTSYLQLFRKSLCYVPMEGKLSPTPESGCCCALTGFAPWSGFAPKGEKRCQSSPLCPPFPQSELCWTLL